MMEWLDFEGVFLFVFLKEKFWVFSTFIQGLPNECFVVITTGFDLALG